MKLWLFWIFGGIDALICIVALVFFFTGLEDGTVSSFNAGIWIGIWAVLAFIMGGGFWLKALGHPGFGMMLFMVLAVPALLYGLFKLLFAITKTPWI